MGLNTLPHDELISFYKNFKSSRSPIDHSDDKQLYHQKDLTDLMEISFNDKPNYLDISRAKLPSVSELFNKQKWINNELYILQLIKRSVHFSKSKTGKHDSRFVNSDEKIAKNLRGDVRVEFSTPGWCIFYDLVGKYELIPIDAISHCTLLSFHLSETPGLFAATLNQYLKLNHPDIKNSFMLQTINHGKLGPDMAGDVANPYYPSYLRRCCGKNLPHLITADGTFDYPDKLDGQESSVSWLHLKESLIALNILRKDGNFVIKVSTYIKCNALCLLTLLATAFEQMALEKPATNEENNSEIFVVCRGYVGRDAIAPYLDRLQQIDLETYQNYSMFPFETNELFYREITKCANHFANLQVNVIERNIRIHESNAEHPNLRKHGNSELNITKHKLCPIKLEDIVEPTHVECIQISSLKVKL